MSLIPKDLTPVLQATASQTPPTQSCTAVFERLQDTPQAPQLSTRSSMLVSQPGITESQSA